MAALISCGVFAPGCGVALAPFILGGAVVGGAATGTAADKIPEATVTPEQARAAAVEALRRLDIQHAVQDRAAAYSRSAMLDPLVTSVHPGPAHPDDRPNYAPLRQEGVDRVLEISVMKAGMHRRGLLSGQSTISISARARLIRAADGAVQYEATHRFLSQPLTLAQWGNNDAETFRRVLERGYQELAEEIVDRLFLVYEPRALDGAAAWNYCTYGPLVPIYPKRDYVECGFCVAGVGRLVFPEVDALQTTLRWEPFPQAEQLDDLRKNDLAAIAEVSYEVRLYEATPFPAGRSWWPGNLVRAGHTTTPSYRLETPLNACTKYFWTFRAHFKMNGRPRTTEWAGARTSRECFLEPLRQVRFYHGFTTPCVETGK